MRETVIVSGARTAISGFDGALKDITCHNLGAIAIQEAVKRANIDPKIVEMAIMGNVIGLGLGPNPARVAMLRAGLELDCGAITVSKVCGSGLAACMLADQAIRSGDCDVVVAGGMEQMYQVPYYLPKARAGYGRWDGIIVDGMVHDGFWDLINDMHMGASSDIIAEKFNITREDQDKFAYNSFLKAKRAIKNGEFKREIVPVEIPQKKGPPVIFDTDELPLRETSLEALAKIKPAFSPKGTCTGGNGSALGNGAAALVFMSFEKAKGLGLKPMAKVVAHGSAGIDPKYVVIAPIYSIPRVAKKAKMELKDIQVHEINEAASASSVYINRYLKLDESIVNMRGGVVALGHPIGCSGARILITLLNIMLDDKLSIGMASACLGGGEAVSMIVEKL